MSPNSIEVGHFLIGVSSRHSFCPVRPVLPGLHLFWSEDDRVASGRLSDWLTPVTCPLVFRPPIPRPVLRLDEWPENRTMHEGAKRHLLGSRRGRHRAAPDIPCSRFASSSGRISVMLLQGCRVPRPYSSRTLGLGGHTVTPLRNSDQVSHQCHFVSAENLPSSHAASRENGEGRSRASCGSARCSSFSSQRILLSRSM